MKRASVFLVMAFVLACSNQARAGLRAGLATADITPPVGGRMAGYGERLLVSARIHDPLGARALVISDGDEALAIVTLDLAGIDKKTSTTVKTGIKEETGIEHVMLLSSHTHSGPEASPAFPSKEKPWITETQHKIVKAVAEAQAALTPVRYGVGKGEVREGHNRRKVHPDGSVTMFWRNEAREATEPVDYELGVIQFNTMDGAAFATLVNFTCHPVVLGPKNLEISADYPGVLRTTVEEAVGGTCLFANGACGDINPFMDKSDPAQGAFEEMEKMGRAVGEEAVRLVKALKMHETNDADLTVRSEAIPVALRWDIQNPGVLEALYAQYGKFIVALILKRLESELPLEGDLVTVTLGDDLAFVGLPGEFFVEHGLRLKKQCVIPNTFVFGYCNNTLAYFPTINAAWQGGYGGKEATLVEVGAGERFINRALINLYYQTGRLRAVPQF